MAWGPAITAAITAAGGYLGAKGSPDELQTTSEPWDPIKPYMGGAAYGIGQMMYDPPTYYPGQTYADLTPWQLSGMQNQINAGDMVGQAGMDAINRLQNFSDSSVGTARAGNTSAVNTQHVQGSPGYQGPSSYNALQSALTGRMNPMTGQVMDMVTNRLNQNFTENVLPALGDEAVAGGQYGGTRQGIAEGIASRGHQQATGDAMTQIGNNALNQALAQQMQAAGLTRGAENLYGQMGQGALNLNAQMGSNANNLNAQLATQASLGNLNANVAARGQDLQALSMIPGMANMMMVPGQTQYNMGSIAQGMNQQAINEDMSRYNFNQDAPWNRTAEALSLIHISEPTRPTRASRMPSSA
mgnify:FL=1